MGKLYWLQELEEVSNADSLYSVQQDDAYIFDQVDPVKLKSNMQ